MTSTSDRKTPPAPPPKLDYLAGVMSYLIPGLGQIMQGRVSKGIVFFISLHTLFFYGWILGHHKNVYLPKANSRDGIAQIPSNLYNRVHFAGQFFIGIAAWPAIWQYYHYDDLKKEGPVIGTVMRMPSGEEINSLQRDENKTWDLGWVYTVIAGVLNILVIYDAVAGPAFREVARKQTDSPNKSDSGDKANGIL